MKKIIGGVMLASVLAVLVVTEIHSENKQSRRQREFSDSFNTALIVQEHIDKNPRGSRRLMDSLTARMLRRDSIPYDTIFILHPPATEHRHRIPTLLDR